MSNSTTPKTDTQTKIEIRSLRHDFTSPERGELGGKLAREIGNHRGIEAEFDQVKADYKAKLAKSEAEIDAFSTNLVNGFDIRPERCVVIFRAADKKKDFYRETDYELCKNLSPVEWPKPALTEDMTSDDFQAELIQAEGNFEERTEIQLFPKLANDYGTLIVGKMKNRWHIALRIHVGRSVLEERLDSEQKSFKSRADAVQRGGKLALDWFKANLHDNAGGFIDPIAQAIAAQLEQS